MKRYMKVFIGLLVLMAVLGAGCYENDSGVTQVISQGSNLGINAQISNCGGFKTGQKALQSQQTQDPLCSDERLIWRYSQASQTVYFLNKDVWLNCCGEHSITTTFNEKTGVYEIHETDKPEFGRNRCYCMCFFDFKIDLPNIPPVTITVELYRHITDEGPQRLVWRGSLALTQGKGDELIQAHVGWCD